MGSFILPLITAWTTIGTTVDLTSYSGFDNGDLLPFNESDIVENPMNEFRSTYYVITDDFIPPSILNIPIDVALSAKKRRSFPSERDLRGVSLLRETNFEQVSLLVVTEYRTVARELKESATLVPGWQKDIDSRMTHYVDRVEYGGHFMSLVRIIPRMSRDTQVIRRIFKDIMGSSGRVTEETAELFTKALKAVEKSEDIRRGDMLVATSPVMYYALNHIDYNSYSDVPSLLKLQKNIPEYIIGREQLSARFRPLQELDERFNTPDKNTLSECYMKLFFVAVNDLERTRNLARDLDATIPHYSPTVDEKCTEFDLKVRSIDEAKIKLLYTNLNVYEDVNRTAFSSFLDEYQKGLDESTEDYYTAYKRLQEEVAFGCWNDFYTPTRGFLKVEENEVVKNITEGGLQECQELCLHDHHERCRAVAYNADDNQCHVYYRSTHSARIVFPKEKDSGFKIYDRKCHM